MGERRRQNGKYRSNLAPLSLTSARAFDLSRLRDKFVNVVAPPPAPLSRSRNLRVRAHLWKWRQSRYRRRAEGDMVRGANRKLLKSIEAAPQPPLKRSLSDYRCFGQFTMHWLEGNICCRTRTRSAIRRY